MTNPHFPRASASSPDEDPTGVRALLSGLPEPDPMPDHLVERISASLAAAQAQRAATSSGDPVTPLVASTRRRPGRVLFGVAGAAAAVVLIAVVGGSLFRTIETQGSGTSASGARASSSREASGAEPPSTLDKAAADSASTPPLIQIRQSETQYSQAGFATQARTLGSAVLGPSPMKATAFAGAGRLSTTAELTGCLRAIGADGAQQVQADLAFYEGAPAVIIVATTDGIPVAYAVGRNCSLADAAVLHPATSLP